MESAGAQAWRISERRTSRSVNRGGVRRAIESRGGGVRWRKQSTAAFPGRSPTVTCDTPVRHHATFALLLLTALAAVPARTQSVTLQAPVQQARLDLPNLSDAIAIDGQVAAIGWRQFGSGGFGIPFAFPGWLYIYADVNGSWVRQAAIQDPANNGYNYFAGAVAVSGDRVVAAATGGSSTYVYLRSGNTWTLEATLPVGGQQVAIQGDTILVGEGSSTAYIFVRSGSTWTQQAALATPDAVRYLGCGNGVALSNGTALIGASAHNGQSGAAYVFVQSGTQWNLQAELDAADGAANDYFGCSVALDGDTALVGAYHSKGDRGAAYVFTRAAGQWTQQAALTASDAAPGGYFGSSVSLSGAAAVIAGNIDSGGAAYGFDLVGGAWKQQAEVSYATNVALSGSTLLVSRPGPSGNQSSVYIYQLPIPQVLNAASLAPGLIAPGEELALMTNLGPDDGVAASPDAMGMFPTQLAGVQVLFDGVAAPLFYVQKQQVDVQAPFELANGVTQIQLVYNNQSTWINTATVQSAAPAIYHVDGGAGAPQALVLNQDGTMNSAANPAPRGSVAAVWGTGGGVTAPASITGGVTPPDSRAPLAESVTVSVGGIPAQTKYHGVAPTLPSAVFQLTFEIPANAPVGPNVPLSIAVGTSQGSDPPAGTTIAVK